MIELLAALSASAAAGIRVALPLLLIGLLQGTNLWKSVPILAHISPPVALGILVSWSLFELLGSLKLVGQRVLHILQLTLSPIVGAIMGISVAQLTHFPNSLVVLIGMVGGLLALVLQLIQVGWFYRLRGLPTWVVLLQDALCVALVIMAVDSPKEGGLIALSLLWVAVHTAKRWRRWYMEQAYSRERSNPRRYKENPD